MACYLHAYRRRKRFSILQSTTVDFHTYLSCLHVEPTIAMPPTIFVTATDSASREGPSEPLRRSHRGATGEFSNQKRKDSSQFETVSGRLMRVDCTRLVWAERVRRVVWMCYGRGIQSGLARGSYCDHNVVGTI